MSLSKASRDSSVSRQGHLKAAVRSAERSPSSTPPRAAVYLRVSTDDQRERQTIATQREFAEQYCATNGVPVYRIYADDGISGTVPIGNRPEGARLLQDAKDGKFSQILVYRLDRLGRDSRVNIDAIGALADLGVTLKSMTEAFDANESSGRFLFNILSAVAVLERETILDRSREGTNRLAREGAWVGGIVPYGYRVVGQHRFARLQVSDEPMAGSSMSEADVIRLIYSMTADEHRTCNEIAVYLNQLGVLPSYARDGRELLRGKRKQLTSGIWRAARIRNMIVNTTYKGIHGYGRRSKKQREVIERQVPAIVTVKQWERAQQVLSEHIVFSDRNAKRKYLLRGLIKCGLCGLTYIGSYYDTSCGKAPRIYYTCNGAHQQRGRYGAMGEHCPSKATSGNIEAAVWDDICGFLQRPSDVLKQLADRLSDQSQESDKLIDQLGTLKQSLIAKRSEQDKVLSLFRRGRIDDRALDEQLNLIQEEETQLQREIDGLSEQTRSAESTSSRLRSAEELLHELHKRLDKHPTWEVKRELVLALVHGIRVDTVECDGKKEAIATVTYCFDSTAIHTDTDSWQIPT